MKTIVVAGRHSRIGKTSFAENLLKIFSGFSALKITTVHTRTCPHGRFCGACQDLDRPYRIIDDERIINTKGKDTQRLKQAGAEKVVWLISEAKALGYALKEAFSLFYFAEYPAACCGDEGESRTLRSSNTKRSEVFERSRVGYSASKNEPSRTSAEIFRSKLQGGSFKGRSKGLIIEGTSVLKYINPDITFYIL